MFGEHKFAVGKDFKNLKQMEVFAVDIVQMICNLLDSKSLARLQQVNRFWKSLLDKHMVHLNKS